MYFYWLAASFLSFKLPNLSIKIKIMERKLHIKIAKGSCEGELVEIFMFSSVTLTMMLTGIIYDKGKLQKKTPWSSSVSMYTRYMNMTNSLGINSSGIIYTIHDRQLQLPQW